MLALIIFLLQSATPPPARWGWPTVAEGWTAPNEESTIDAAYRMFSAPDLEDICRRAAATARLVGKGPVELRVGQWFEFTSLRIIAVGAANHKLPPVPVALEIEETDPPLFTLRNDIIGHGGATPFRAGRFRFRARTLCPGTSGEVFVPAVVRER